MIKLFSLEFLKNKSNASFWAFLAIYLVAVYVVCSAGTVLMNATLQINSTGPEPAELPDLSIYNFPTIWHNLTYLGSFVSTFLSIIVIINITNEISYKTLRQNLIDGLSKFDLLISKSILIVFITLFSTFSISLITYYFGYNYSKPYELKDVFHGIEFIGGYFLEILGSLSFALFIGLALRKTGISVLFILAFNFFMFVSSFIATTVLNDEGTFAFVINILNVADNVVTAPFNLINPEAAQVALSLHTSILSLVWTFFFLLMSFIILKKRDW